MRGPFGWTGISIETILCGFYSQLLSYQKHRVKEKSMFLRSSKWPELSCPSLYTLEISTERGMGKSNFLLTIRVLASGVPTPPGYRYKRAPCWGRVFLPSSCCDWILQSVFFHSPVDRRDIRFHNHKPVLTRRWAYAWETEYSTLKTKIL